MSNLKISELADAATLTGAEIAPLVQSGANKKLSLAAIINGILGGTWGSNVGKLNELITAMSLSLDPIFGKVFSGWYYSSSPRGAISTGLVVTQGDLRLTPYFCVGKDVVIDRFGQSVSTASTLGTHAAKLGIYSSDSDGMPSSLLHNLGEVTGFNSTNLKLATCALTLQRGKIYWLASLADHNAQLRSHNSANTLSLGTSTTGGSNYTSIVRTGLTYASGLPSSLTISTADLSANLPPAFFIRAA